MSIVINLHDMRALRDVHQCVQEAKLEVEKGLTVAQCADVSDLNGRQLRQFRDEVLRLQRMAVVNSPEAEALLRQAITERGRALEHAEVQEILRPLLARVRIRYAIDCE